MSPRCAWKVSTTFTNSLAFVQASVAEVIRYSFLSLPPPPFPAILSSLFFPLLSPFFFFLNMSGPSIYAPDANLDDMGLPRWIQCGLQMTSTSTTRTMTTPSLLQPSPTSTPQVCPPQTAVKCSHSQANSLPPFWFPGQHHQWAHPQ